MKLRDTYDKLRIARQMIREVQAYWSAARPVPCERGVRALIFAQGRTGSTLLESLICSSGHFKENGEPLRNIGSKVLFPGPYVRGLSQRRPGDNFVCHVKLYQLTRDRVRAGRCPISPSTFLHQFSDEGWKVIYLRRDDKIRHALSTFVVEARGKYHKTDSRPESVTVHVYRRQLKGLVQERIHFEEEERKAIAGIDYHEVVYERDLQDRAAHQQTANKVFDFLSLERRPVETRLRKVNARPLRQIVSNYDEFAEWARELREKLSLGEPSSDVAAR